MITSQQRQGQALLIDSPSLHHQGQHRAGLNQQMAHQMLEDDRRVLLHRRDAGKLGEDEELHGRVGPVLMPPDRDQQVHGYEHHFPEQEEQEQQELAFITNINVKSTRFS